MSALFQKTPTKKPGFSGHEKRCFEPCHQRQGGVAKHVKRAPALGLGGHLACVRLLSSTAQETQDSFFPAALPASTVKSDVAGDLQDLLIVLSNDASGKSGAGRGSDIDLFKPVAVKLEVSHDA